MRVLLFVITLIISSCGVNENQPLSTNVNISFGNTTLAIGALGAPGDIPNNIQSVSVVAINATGNIVAGPIVANRPDFTLKIRVPNGNNIRFRILAYAGKDAAGVVLYKTLSAPVNLEGKPVTVPVKMNFSIEVSAKNTIVFRGDAVTLTGLVSGSAPNNSTALQWSNTGGMLTHDTYGAIAVWVAPASLGKFTISAIIDPNVNADQDPNTKGSVVIDVVNQDPYVQTFNNSSITLNAGTNLVVPLAIFGDLDGDVLQAALQPNKPNWVGLTTTGNNPLTTSLNLSPPLGTNGDFSITIGITDGFGGTLTRVIPINVSTTITAPIIQSDLSTTISTTSFDIYGSAILGTTVDIYANSTFVAQVNTTNLIPKGGFTYTFQNMTDGNYAIQAFASFANTTSPSSNTLNVTVALPPQPSITVNNPLSLDNSTSVAIIASSLLTTTDADTATSSLTYTATSNPTKGSLNLTTFTQADIDNNLLKYTPSNGASGVDGFNFAVSDGTTSRNGIFAIIYNFGTAKTVISAANNNNIIAGALCDTTWDLYGSPYFIGGSNVGIGDSCNLTIKAGVVVKSLANTLVVNGGGTLNIQGIQNQPVYFTSFKDDSIGGDSNGDGAASSPLSGEGLSFIFSAGSFSNIAFLTTKYSNNFSINANITLDHVNRYLAENPMTISGSSPTISNITIEHANTVNPQALVIDAANPVFSGQNTIDKYSAVASAVVIQNGSNPTLDGFTIDLHGNQVPAIFITGASTTGSLKNSTIQNSGKAILVNDSAAPSIQNIILRNSQAGIHIGTAGFPAGQLNIINNKIVNNTFGIFIEENTQLLMFDNLIRANANAGVYIGIKNEGANAIVIRNNVLAENAVGIRLIGDANSATTTKATLQSNSLTANGIGLQADLYTLINMQYNIIAKSSSLTDMAIASPLSLIESYNLTSDNSLTGLGDVYANPEFVLGVYLSDGTAANGNSAITSPAIDAGNTGSDLVSANLTTNPYAQVNLADQTPLDFGYHYTRRAPIIHAANTVVTQSTGVPNGSNIVITIILTPKDSTGIIIGAGLPVQGTKLDNVNASMNPFAIDNGDGTYTFTYSTTNSVGTDTISFTVSNVNLNPKSITW